MFQVKLKISYLDCRYPFLASEILTSDSSKILEKLFIIENENEKNEPNILKIFHKLTSIDCDIDSILPGYLERILTNLIKKNPIQMMKLLNSFPVFINLIDRMEIESISEILFQFVILKSSGLSEENNNENQIEIKKYLDTKCSIIDCLFKKIKEDFQKCKIQLNFFNLDFYSQIKDKNNLLPLSLERLINSFNLLTKIIKFAFCLQEGPEILNKIIALDNFEIIDNIIINMCYKIDSNSKINENHIRLIQHNFTFLFNILEITLIPPISKNFNDVITSSQYSDDIIKYLNDNSIQTQQISSDNKNESVSTTISSNFMEDLVEKNLSQRTTGNKLKIPNLFNSISEELKSYLTGKFMNVFPKLHDLANQIKILMKNTKYSPTLDDKIVIIPLSQTYLIFLDIFIYSLIIKNSNFRETLKNSENLLIYENLIQDATIYPNNSFLLNKIIKIFEIVLFDEFYEEIKLSLIQNGNLFKTLANLVNFKDFIILEEKIINHNNYTLNYSHLMRLLNYFYVSIRNSKNTNFKLSDDELEAFESYLFVYLNLTTQDLLSNEIQSKEDLKNAGDEDIKINLEKNFYDSEAFLFTTKKILENSKNVNRKLKELL